MNKFIPNLGLMLAALLAGCGTPQAQKLPAVSLECRVVTVATFQPVEGAEVVWSYVGPAGEQVDFGPFRTGRDGQCRVIVLPQELRPIHAIDYMAGGFYRAVRVSAPGFETGQWGEGDLRDRIERNVTRPIEFRLKKEPAEPTSGSRPDAGHL